MMDQKQTMMLIKIIRRFDYLLRWLSLLDTLLVSISWLYVVIGDQKITLLCGWVRPPLSLSVFQKKPASELPKQKNK